MPKIAGGIMISSGLEFTVGISELDELVGKITPPYTILISGNPGAGKTTMASTICYNNAIRGNKCLYITFYEDKEKLYRSMGKIGINLEEAEKMGAMRFLKLPVSLDIENLVNLISKNVVEGGFKVVVIDSITVILEALTQDPAKRAWVLNYFYQLPSIVNGLLVLVAELSIKNATVDHSFLEFVVDAVFALRYKVEHGYVTRMLELRKIRGVKVNLVEIPFTIVEGRGLKPYIVPAPEKIPEQLEEIEMPCTVLKEKIGHIHRDFLVNIFYPPEGKRGREILLLALALALKYNMKVLVISYVSSPRSLAESVISLLEEYVKIPRKAIADLVKKHLIIKGINPFAYNLIELAMEERELIERYNPNIVVFHGTEVAMQLHSPKAYFKELYNQVLYLKSKGIIVVRTINYIDEDLCKLQASIGDLNAIISFIRSGEKIDYIVYIHRRFRDPKTLTWNDVVNCLKECGEYIKKRVLGE